MSERDPIEYLINAMDAAGQNVDPFRAGYGDKRKAVLDAVKSLRAENAMLRAQLRAAEDRPFLSGKAS